MAKATIKARSGMLITVEGTDAEVSSIVTTIDQAHAGTRKPKRTVTEESSKRPQKRRTAAADLVIELKESGFFDKPRALNDISKALQEQGFVYPVTTLSGVMLNLVQKKFLGRKKFEGRWAYGR